MRRFTLVATALAMAAIAGCGDSGERSGQTSPPGPTEAELTFVYRADESATPERIALSCPGSDRVAKATCRELDRVPSETFEPVPAGTACTEIYGGPEVLQITGRLGDETIDSEFSRVNGCEISRWDAIAPVLEALGLGAVGETPPR